MKKNHIEGSNLQMTRFGIVLCLVATTAHAQPTAALIQTQASQDEEGLARVVRGRTQRLDVVEFTAAPALKLEDIQLMVGCLNNSVECYRSFAAQLEVDTLLIPSVESTGTDSIITVAFFDGDEIRQASRHAESGESESLIASIDGLLRELFDLPALEPDGPVDAPRPETPTSTTEVVETLSPVGPIVGGVGIAVLAAALGVGVAANNAEDDYRAASVSTVDEIDAALNIRSEAQTKARAANALLGVGLAALAAGVVLTVVLRDKSNVRVGAAVAPGAAAVTVGGTL